jgi:ribosomal protein S18 acetylase RimI-like enzyme
MDGAKRVAYRACERSDARGIAEVLYRTGFLGEDLTGRGLFGDKRLFAIANTDCYVRRETRNAFVAVEESTRKILGYIIGAADTRAYEGLFKRRMYWRMALRAIFVSSWKYPESFRQILAWAKNDPGDPGRFNKDYPAHLHINVLPECQRLGIGERLMELFVRNMASRGVKGIHLGTSNRNLKALPFYKKQGFEILAEEPGTFWTGLEGHVSVIFGKRL